jgi:acyl-CoA synthetase (AMP-forming)/AMP-acid ligase II
MGPIQSSSNTNTNNNSLRDLVRKSFRGLGVSSNSNNNTSNSSPTTNTTFPSQRLRVTTFLFQNAQQRPTSIATIDVKSQRNKTWAEITHRVQKLSTGLKLAIPSIEIGSRVAILSFNSDLYFEIMFACACLGVISVPLNFRLSPEELAHCINDSGSMILMVDEAWAKDLIPKVRPLLLNNQIKKIILIGAGDAHELLGTETISSEDIIASVTDGITPLEPISTRGGDDILSIYYTGGTTGKAKGVCLSHTNVIVNAFGTLVFQNDYRADTVFLHIAPMFHLADAQHVWIGTMAGCQHVFCERFAPPELFPVMEKYNVTKLVLVPMMIQMLLNLKDVEQQVANMKDRPIELMYGGSPMSSTMMDGWMKLFPKGKLFQGFGMTETAPAISMLSHEDHTRNNKMHTVGRPVPYSEVIIADENDKEVSKRGTTGEILVRGPQVMVGYWNLPELTRETLKGGWMHTGDGGYMDEDGYIVLCDRIKFMIKTGGENVFSSEVENVLSGMPGVAMNCVVGAPDDTYGEIVVAVLVAKNKGEEITLEAIKTFCKEKNLAGYKIPKRVVMRDSLPLSGPGKVLKNEVKKQLGYSSGNAVVGGERKTAYS